MKLANLFAAQDMTTGKPMSRLLQFSIPLLIGNLAQQMYNTVDSIVVGQFVGDNALAAVGASGPVLNLLLVLFMGISSGCGIMVSQYFGAKDRDNLSHTVGTALTLITIASAIIMVAGPLLTGPLMSLLDTPVEIYGMSCSYLTIIFVGIIGTAFYNIVSGMLRGLGDSFTPLLFLLLACGLNIVLDLLFVIAFDWKVDGVAWATIIAQAVSGVLCLIRLFRMHDVLDIKPSILKPRKALVLQTIKLGLPAGLTQAIFSLASIVVQALINTFGTIVITCAIVVMRVDGFAMMPNFTYGAAMITYTGQNVGAGKLGRVKKGAKAGLTLGLCTSIVLVIALMFFGKYLMMLFTNTPEVINMGVHMMQILAVGYVAVSVTQVLCGVMSGSGDTVTPMLISLTTTVAIRVPLAYFIAELTKTAELPTGSEDCIFISLLVSWVLGAVLSFLFYKFGGWHKKAEAFAKPETVDAE